MTIKKSLKQFTLSVLRETGSFSVISHLKGRQNKLLILCYHGIALDDEHEWRGQLFITPNRFRRRLEMLKAYGANVVPLNEGVERLRTQSLQPRSVVITFDDGFHDFYLHAAPLLRTFEYPCTLYLTTHYCKYRVPVFNLIVSYMLWKSGIADFVFPGIGIEKAVQVRDNGERAKAVQSIISWTDSRQMTTLEKDQVARELASHLRIGYDDLIRRRLLQIMSESEVSSIASAGVQIELHTHRHKTPRDRDLFEREVRDNRERIREYTGSEPTHFCYPSGDYAYEFLPWLRGLGVKSATTCELGLAKQDSEPLLLPRFLDATDVGEIEFESWLSGVRG
jgi:peptidoglycan/xylan/chitin deacetylase (PgdA/CDA1 family)